MRKGGRALGLAGVVGAGLLAVTAGAQESVELAGRVPFDVASPSGLVRTVEVTVGDGGSGPFSAVLVGHAALPTHTIYRPRDLSALGPSRRLPIVAWANGGCRNSSGEFRNFLTEIASHGFLIVAIGPAASAATMGSEAPTGTSTAAQLIDGVNWAIGEATRVGGAYAGRIDTSKIAVMGQSCGGVQALDVSQDPRVTTTVVWNSGVLADTLVGARAGAATGLPAPVLESMAPMIRRMTRDRLRELHGPVAYVIGGPSDIAFGPAAADVATIEHVPVLLANRSVGHYPATYREPHGGAFAAVAVAWLAWQLQADPVAARQFVGDDCGLCRDAAWTIQRRQFPTSVAGSRR